MVRAFDPGSRAIVPKVDEGSLSFYVGGTRLWAPSVSLHPLIDLLIADRDAPPEPRKGDGSILQPGVPFPT